MDKTIREENLIASPEIEQHAFKKRKHKETSKKSTKKAKTEDIPYSSPQTSSQEKNQEKQYKQKTMKLPFPKIEATMSTKKPEQPDVTQAMNQAIRRILAETMNSV